LIYNRFGAKVEAVRGGAAGPSVIKQIHMSEADSRLMREGQLLNQLRQGDRSALATLFDLHRDRLRRTLEFRMDRRLAARVDADDILQEAYLAAASRVEYLLAKPDALPFVWFRLILGQTLVDVHRRHVGAEMRAAGREMSLNGRLFPQATSVCLAAELIGSFTSPSQAAARVELSLQLEQAIATMSDVDQEIIALRHFEELTNQEAAEALELSPTAASNRYVRAIARLKEILEGLSDFGKA